MQTLKHTLLKSFVLLAVFCGVTAAYFLINHKEPVSPAENLDTATLPVVTVKYKDMELNALHGYTGEMEAVYMRDVITPVENSRLLPLNIYKYGNNIAGISYEIRSLDTARLIEKVDLTQWSGDDSYINVTLDISKMPEMDTEYLLILKLTTEKHGSVRYYTRIIDQSSSDISQQMAFVNDFSESTLDDKRFEKFIGNLEINPSRDNTNLADVDLNSSFNNLTWGNMKVERVSTPVVSITEISGDTSCFQLKYKVRSQNIYETYQYYNVTEFFRVKIGINITYLYVYDRTVEQVFDPITQNISATRINLGLDSDLSVKYKSNNSGSFVSFVKDGSLWTMDMKNNKILSLFSFEAMEADDVRNEYDQYDIDIISTDKNGNTMFLVYGYMEKGAHEGQVGVALYQYIYKENTVKELVFVPSTKPYSMIKDSVGKFAYLTDKDILYFMIGNSIYTVAMDSNEYMQLATDLQPGNYIINSDNSILAWHENSSVYGADSIRVIDVEAHRDYTINADDGEYIKVIGFIENDMIYGVARQSDISTDSSGNTVFPMYKLVIQKYDEVSEEETTTAPYTAFSGETEVYEKENVYVYDVSVNENIMSLKRLKREESGVFSAIDDDKLVNRNAENGSLITLDTIATDLKKKELVLYFAYSITSSEPLSLVTTETYEFTSANKLQLNNESLEDNQYFVYAYGGLYGKYENLKTAIEAADSNFGFVIKPTGQIAWAKITKPDLAKLPDTGALVGKHYSSLDEIKNDSDYVTYDLTGIETANVLYYGAKNIPVITHIDGLGNVIISAYSSYLGMVDTFAFTRLDTGEIVKMPYDEGVSKIKASGSVFVVMEKKE